MPIKLVKATSKEDKDLPKISINFWAGAGEAGTHNLRIHQDSKGVWWPELNVSTHNCESSNIGNLRATLAAALDEAADLIRSSDLNMLKSLADLVYSETEDDYASL